MILNSYEKTRKFEKAFSFTHYSDLVCGKSVRVKFDNFPWVSQLKNMESWMVSTFLTPCFSILILKKNIKLHLDIFSTHFVRTMREGKYHFSGLENIYFCRVTWKEKNRVGTSFSKGQLFIFWDQQDSCLSSAVRLDGPGDQGDGKVGPRKISFLKNFCLLSG